MSDTGGRLVLEQLSLDDFDVIKCEVMTQTDRGAAVLAASLLDEHLKWAIDRTFVELTNKDTKTIFAGTGPLATFKARTDIAFALGLIDRNCRIELGAVAQIRNRFAHRVEVITFDNPQVAEICARLSFPSRRKLYVGVLKGKPGVNLGRSEKLSRFIHGDLSYI